MKHLFLFSLTIIMNVSITYAQIIDSTFIEPLTIRPAKINCIKVLNDGKIFLGGDIAFFKTERVNNLIRLNSDSTVDETFSFKGDGSLIIRKIEFQSTGDIIVLAYYEPKNILIESEKSSLFIISSNGDIKKEIDGLIECKSFAIQNDDKILICSSTNHLFRFNSDLSADPIFNNRVSINGLVYDIKVDGNKIYACGTFSSVNDTIKNGIVKLNLDGTIDTSFDVGTGTSDPLLGMTIQLDHKILLGKTYINSFNGIPFHGMVRLNPDGKVDTGFNPPFLNSTSSEITIKDNSIYFSAWLDNSYGMVPYFIKLMPDGSLDEDFNIVKLDDQGFKDFNIGFIGNKIIFNNSTTISNKYGLSKCDSVGNIVNIFKPKVSRFGEVSTGNYFNGKLLISGDFIKVNDVESYGIAMLDKNGVVNDSFILPKNHGTVQQLQILNDTSIFVSTGNSFFKLNDKAQILQDFNFTKDTKLNEILKFKALENGKIIAADANGIHRLNADGTEDPTFNTGAGIGNSSTGLDFTLQGEKIIWGSDFNTYNGTNVHKLIRLNTDGSIDPTFNIGTGPDGIVFITKVLDSGDMIVGGWFSSFNGSNVPHGIVKLSKNGEMDQLFNDNQDLPSSKMGLYSLAAKVEQVDSVIYIKEKDLITTVNLRGTYIKDFKVPVKINNINDIVTMKDSSQNGGLKKSTSLSNTKAYMFALGSFIKSNNSDPSFIVKLNLATPSVLSVSTPTINVAASANSIATFDITSNISWNVVSDQTWLTVNKVSGSNSATISLTALDNLASNVRTATLTISGNGLSKTVIITQAAGITGIKEISDSDIQLYPIPTIDKMYISFQKPFFQTSITIYSMTGQPIYFNKINNSITVVDMSKFVQGVYFVKIVTNDNDILTKKIIKH